jgi:hypothetical protein
VSTEFANRCLCLYNIGLMLVEKPGFVPEHLRGTGKDFILFPKPTFLAPIWVKFGKELGEQAIDEYFSVLRALDSVRGHELKIVKNATTLLTKDEFGRTVPKTADFEDITGVENIELRLPPYATENSFPRDIFVNLGDFLFVNPAAIEIANTGLVYPSPLGEGGKVLCSGKSVIVSEDIWSNRELKPQFKMLKEAGYKFGAIPLVRNDNRERGENYFVGDHIDGHTAIIADKDGRNHVLFAKSYASQSAKTRAKILEACDYIEAEPIEIDDAKQTFLALNLTQFKEGTVIVTKGADEIIEIVSDLVGPGKVISTSESIDVIPRYLAGGIHCMTNVCPEWLLKIIKKPPLYTRPSV